MVDPQVCYNLLRMLTDEVPRSTVRDFLEQSLIACEGCDWEQMSEMAENAILRARRQDERTAEAAALVHQGVARAQLDRVDIALNACERAKRIYRRDPDWRQRFGEGLAALVVGLIDGRRLDALNYFREALDLFERLQECYAAEGNHSRQQEMERLCEALRLKISGRTLIIYLGGKAHMLTPPTGHDRWLLELQPNVEYRVIPIDRDDYQEFGLTPNDSILVRRVGQVHEITPGLAVWYETSGEYTLGRFERDQHGNVHFMQVGAGERLIGTSDVKSVGCVDAVIRPTWPLM